MSIQKYRKKMLYPWISWGIVAFLYLIQYGLMIVPSVFTEGLQQSLSINRAGVGVLFTAFLYTYVAMQIPAGVMYDRFNSRRVLLMSTMIIIFGSLVLAVASNLWVAILGRMILGFGGSFAFIGALYVGRTWFRVSLFPLIIGLTESMSGLSQIALMPLMAVLKNFQNWRVISLEITAIVVILGVLIFFFVQDRRPAQKLQKKHERSDFNLVLKNSAVWLLALFVGFTFAFDMSIANMWGVPLFVSHYHIPTWLAAVESGVIMVGFTLGCYLIAFIARYFSDRLLMLLFSGIQLILTILLWFLKLNLIELGSIIFLIGFSSSAMLLCFDLVKKFIPQSSYGLASGFLNMFFGAVGIVFSTLIGYIFQVTNDINASLVPIIGASFVAFFCGVLLKFKKIKMLPLKLQGEQ